MNPFDEEWRKCLREHYKYVIRQDDTITRQSLTRVLLNGTVGFTEDELHQLYVEATMHADDFDSDTLPNPDVVTSDVANATTFQTHPAECTCDLCSPLQERIDAMLEAGHDAEGQPLSSQALQEAIEEAQAKSSNDDDSPTQRQMSLF